MWRGRYNVIVVLIFIGIVGASIALKSDVLAVVGIGLLVGARVLIWALNLLSIAFLGRPLIYDILIRERR